MRRAQPNTTGRWGAKFRPRNGWKQRQNQNDLSGTRGKGFASRQTGSVSPMVPAHMNDVYSPDEIARAAGVPEEVVVAAMGGPDALVVFADAVRIGRSVRAGLDAVPSAATGRSVMAGGTAPRPPLFAIFQTADRSTSKSMPLVVSSTVHVTVLAAAIAIATFGLTPKAATLPADPPRPDQLRLVFIATPGPGGGGGGGGTLRKAPPPKAERDGTQKMSSPLPIRQPPKPIAPIPKPSEPKPAPLNAEQLPVVVAPIVAAPADTRNRVGVLEDTTAQTDSRGSGRGGGVGTGTGTGVGEGEGAGIGPGSGGGIGGGPYRAGSGITPPRVVREVKADYTEEARRRGVTGEVIMEIVVRRDGSVGDVKVLQGLGSGLNDRAVQAVRQWRFAPAERQGTPVDVVVEVSVEFKLR
jgi:protein TonB